MITAPFRYLCPSSLEEALAALETETGEVRPLAGGQSLVPLMKLRLAQPDLVLDIGRLPLAGIDRNGGCEIGALTRYDELARADLGAALRSIVEAAASVGDLQVRNAGTVGGAVAHGDPASDVAAALIAVGAQVKLRSGDGARAVAIDDFLRGPFTTDLRDGELVVAVSIDDASVVGSAYASFRHPPSGYAIAGAAAGVQRTGARLTWRIGLCGALARPQRAQSLEDLLASTGDAEPALEDIASRLGDVEFVSDDAHVRSLFAVVIRDAARQALARGAASA
jgi:carbon-monoxide dehydrogenase medium subunit